MQKKKLWQQLKHSSPDAAKKTLSILPCERALVLLTTLMQRDNQRVHFCWFFFRAVAIPLMCLGIAYSIWSITSGVAKDPFTRGINTLVLLIYLPLVARYRGTSKRNKTIFTLLPDLLSRATRAELGAVLEFGSHAALSPLAKAPDSLDKLFQWLGHVLPRTPLDDLEALSPEARHGLRLLTQEAIEKSKTEQKAEALAVAGLLALGSLKDTSLKKVADGVRAVHKSEQVRAAAAEYLSQL
ncbi:hypothetical protein [Armatimonas sp.]|uniref:hypothetical protein n=1 Tax=Armatimonas sp. TaxID=1872638 RepID=UPI00286A8424|nr:hypothetical protein [Armatimonas sp.]